MADFEEDNPPGQSEYISERVRVMERFIALGGGTPIDHDLRSMPKIEDHITDRHRELVSDLVAQGLADDAVARIMGISKERLQTLFAREIGTAFEIADSGAKRTLWRKGMSGDTVALRAWIGMHNRGTWADKRELTDKGADQVEAAESGLDAARLLVDGLIAGIATAQNLRGPETEKVRPVAPKKAETKPKPVGYHPKPIRKVRQET